MPDAPEVPDQLPIPLEPAPAPPPEFRYAETEETPEFLRGKTTTEVANLFQALTAEREAEPVRSNGNGHAAPVPPPPPAPVEPPGPSLQRVAEQQANLSYDIARRNHAPIFQKYGPEIDQMLARVPKADWSLDLIDKAVKFTQGNHLDEILNERMRQATEVVNSTMRSNGRSGGGNYSGYEATPSPQDAAPESWKEHARKVGITDATVAEFCRATETTPAEFWAQFKNGGIISDAVADTNFGRSNDAR